MASNLTRPSYWRSMPKARPTDVSGRPLRLRDVDIDAFLHPKTIAVIGASEMSAKPNTAMTRKFDPWFSGGYALWVVAYVASTNLSLTDTWSRMATRILAM